MCEWVHVTSAGKRKVWKELHKWKSKSRTGKDNQKLILIILVCCNGARRWGWWSIGAESCHHNLLPPRQPIGKFTYNGGWGTWRPSHTIYIDNITEYSISSFGFDTAKILHMVWFKMIWDRSFLLSLETAVQQLSFNGQGNSLNE